MVSWIKSHSVSAIVCGLTLLLPLLLYFYVTGGLLSLRSEYQQEIDRLEPRLARLKGLYENEALMQASATELQGLLERRVFPPDLDRVSIAATMQKDLKQVFADAGMAVSSSQALPLRREGNFDHVLVRYTVTGTLRGLDDALRRIAEFTPLVLVASVELAPRRVRSSDAPSQTLTATLQLLSLRDVE